MSVKIERLKDGTLVRELISYHGNGKVFEISVKEGSSKSVKYYDINGTLRRESNYIDGKKNGTQRHYYVTGRLEFEKSYKDDRLDGISKLYCKSGSLHWKTMYEDGKRIGTSKLINSNGSTVLESRDKYLRFFWENG